jgi:hypothetical protein
LIIREEKMEYTAEIIKEFKGGTVVLRTNTYCNAVAYIQHLFNEAKKDFPTLDAEKVRTVIFGGRHYKGTMGIEFDTMLEKPEAYEEIAELERVL